CAGYPSSRTWPPLGQRYHRGGRFAVCRLLLTHSRFSSTEYWSGRRGARGAERRTLDTRAAGAARGGAQRTRRRAAARRAAAGPAYRDSGFAMQWNPCSFPARSYELWTFVSSLARPGTSGYTMVDVAAARCPPGGELYRADWRDSRGGRSERAEQELVGDAWAI